MERIRVKRIYDPPSKDDGARILVDRVWPRGMTKDKAHVDLWLKEAAPSAELRRWFGHDPARWAEFRRRYHRELRGRDALLHEATALANKGTVTLLFSARDTEHNNAVALRDYLREHASGS